LLLINLFEANSNFFKFGRAGKFARDLIPHSLRDRCVQSVNLSKKALSSGVSSNSGRPSNIKFWNYMFKVTFTNAYRGICQVLHLMRHVVPDGGLYPGLVLGLNRLLLLGRLAIFFCL
jgi:hypothetical protein